MCRAQSSGPDESNKKQGSFPGQGGGTEEHSDLLCSDWLSVSILKNGSIWVESDYDDWGFWGWPFATLAHGGHAQSTDTTGYFSRRHRGKNHWGVVRGVWFPELCLFLFPPPPCPALCLSPGPDNTITSPHPVFLDLEVAVFGIAAACKVFQNLGRSVWIFCTCLNTWRPRQKLGCGKVGMGGSDGRSDSSVCKMNNWNPQFVCNREW